MVNQKKSFTDFLTRTNSSLTAFIQYFCYLQHLRRLDAWFELTVSYFVLSPG